MIVIGDVFHEFSVRLKDAMESLKIGPPEDSRNYMGPLVDEAALKKVRRYIEIGETEGKILLRRRVQARRLLPRPGHYSRREP